jgi:hypothetical protein
MAHRGVGAYLQICSKTATKLLPLLFGKSILNFFVLAAWRGHRSRLRDSRPGFESRQGISFLGKTMLLCVFDLIFSVCVLTKRNKGIGPKIFKKYIII